MTTLRRLPESTAIAPPAAVPYWADNNGVSQMGAPGATPPSLAQLVAILRFHLRRSLQIAGILALLSVLVLFLLPKTYVGVATLMVDAARKNPLAAQPIEAYAVQGYIQTQIELIKGPVILTRVVDRLYLTKDRVFASGYRGSDEAGLREYAATNLAKDINVELGRGGQLLQVSAISDNAPRAAELANAVADVYIEEEERNFSSPISERAARYSKDLVELRRKLKIAEENLASFRSSNHLANATSGTGADVDSETQRLNDLNVRLIAAQNQRRALESRGVGEVDAGDEAMTSPVVQGVKTELANLNAELAKLSAVYGPQHPKVIEVNSKIEATSKQYRDELQMLTGNTSNGLARARDLERKLTVAVAAQNERVVTLRGQQGEGARLTLELESAQAVYKRALDGYDQILFASYGNNDNISVVRRAVVPIKSTRPNKLKWLIVCLALSGLAGLLAPLAMELTSMRRRVHSRADIEGSFGIPVMAQLTAVYTGSPGQ